jgi:hypothetical protein
VLVGGLLAAIIGLNLAAWTHLRNAAHPFLVTMLSFIPISLVMISLLWRMDLPRPTLEETGGKQRPLKVIIRQPAFVVAVARNDCLRCNDAVEDG